MAGGAENPAQHQGEDLDHHLQDPEVVEDREEGGKEDDGREDFEGKAPDIEEAAENKAGPVRCGEKQYIDRIPQEVKHLFPGACFEDKEPEEDLHPEAEENDFVFDFFPVFRQEDRDKDEKRDTAQSDELFHGVLLS